MNPWKWILRKRKRQFLYFYLISTYMNWFIFYFGVVGIIKIAPIQQPKTNNIQFSRSSLHIFPIKIKEENKNENIFLTRMRTSSEKGNIVRINKIITDNSKTNSFSRWLSFCYCFCLGPFSVRFVSISPIWSPPTTSSSFSSHFWCSTHRYSFSRQRSW